MKNALLVYTEDAQLCNIGDYVQSIAAKQYFENVDVEINRERLNSYVGEDAKLIMNGWFTHEPRNWPPAEKLKPLFVSFHVNSVAATDLLTQTNIEYLKRHEPIGCRDRETARLLSERGVEAYFSGCLTLTLGRTYKRAEQPDGVVFVDPYFEIRKDFVSLIRYCFGLFASFPTIFSIAPRLEGQRSLVSLLRTSAFVKTYQRMFETKVLKQAQYIRQQLPTSELGDHSKKFDLADKFLRTYCGSSYVVTSRIHCALPCVGMGVPVIYVNNVNQAETSSCRLDGLLELFNVLDLDGESWNPRFDAGFPLTVNSKVRNKTVHENLVAGLSAACLNFASDSPASRSIAT